MKDNSIIAIQDMGAAGLTCSSFEMAAKGNCGIELNINKISCKKKPLGIQRLFYWDGFDS